MGDASIFPRDPLRGQRPQHCQDFSKLYPQPSPSPFKLVISDLVLSVYHKHYRKQPMHTKMHLSQILSVHLQISCLVQLLSGVNSSSSHHILQSLDREVLSPTGHRCRRWGKEGRAWAGLAAPCASVISLLPHILHLSVSCETKCSKTWCN